MEQFLYLFLKIDFMGEELFKSIEEKIIQFLEKHYEKIFSDPKINLNHYIEDYKNYYYFPTILKIINKFS